MFIEIMNGDDIRVIYPGDGDGFMEKERTQFVHSHKLSCQGVWIQDF